MPEPTNPDTPKTAPPAPAFKPGPRTWTGLAVLVVATIMPLFALGVPFLGLPKAWATLVATALLVGGPEALTLVAVVLLGRENLNWVTARVKKALRHAVLETRVSRTQYYVGLGLSLITILPLYLYGYFPTLLPDTWRIPLIAGADLLFIASMFIMGGEFWEKLQRIFIWEGERHRD